MKRITEKALALWGMTGAGCNLFAARENHVFRVEWQGTAYALRLHRVGYRSDAELLSELTWMNALSEAGLSVPAAIPAADGRFLRVIDGAQVDVLTWLDGVPMGKTGQALEIGNRVAFFERLGRETARLHEASDAWELPPVFTRVHWDREGLLGDTPLWGRFWEHPSLSVEDKALFAKARSCAAQDLQTLEDGLDYGLIHADLVRENILIRGEDLQLIDFDDAGFGFRLFDLATTLLKNRAEPDFAALRRALLTGYRAVRPLDNAALDLFMLLRSLTYVGWIISRMDEPGSAARSQRFIKTARETSLTYLQDKGYAT